MSSTRLKKKPILKIKNKEMITHQIEMLKKNFTSNKIILATSKYKIDDPLVELAKKMKINFFRGSKKDVLMRIFKTCDKYNFENTIILNGDNPLVHPNIIKKMYLIYKKGKYDYLDAYEELPIGIWPKIIKKSAIKKVCEIKNKTDTEAYSLWFYKLEKIFKIGKYKNKNLKKFIKLRLTVDTIDDFKLVKLIIEKFLVPNQKNYNLFSMLKYVQNNKKIYRINSKVKQISADKFPFGVKKKYVNFL